MNNLPLAHHQSENEKHMAPGRVIRLIHLLAPEDRGGVVLQTVGNIAQICWVFPQLFTISFAYFSIALPLGSVFSLYILTYQEPIIGSWIYLVRFSFPVLRYPLHGCKQL